MTNNPHGHLFILLTLVSFPPSKPNQPRERKISFLWVCLIVIYFSTFSRSVPPPCTKVLKGFIKKMYEDAPSTPLLSFYNSSKLEESAENDALGVEQDSHYSRPTLSEVCFCDARLLVVFFACCALVLILSLFLSGG